MKIKINNNLFIINDKYFLFCGKYLINLDFIEIEGDSINIDIDQTFQIYLSNNICNATPFRKCTWHELVNYIKKG